MKISHEVPICLLNRSKDFNDYDYCLLHLLEKKDYLQYFQEASKDGREIILDNSLFELGSAMTPEKLIEGINLINPTWYVVPDTNNDCDATIAQFEDWKKNHIHKVKGKTIGVVQGKTLEDMVRCYKYLSKNADKIALPGLRANAYLDFFPGIPNKLERTILGRQFFIRYLMREGIWNFEKPHHILGATLAREFMDPIYKYVDSVDTSNPIVAGVMGLTYSETGLEEKPSVMLCELIDKKLTVLQSEDIMHNVKMFRKIANHYLSSGGN